MRTGSKHPSNVQGNEENTEMETNFRILPIYFFFGIKNVRVGRSIGNTPNFLDMMNKTMYSDY